MDIKQKMDIKKVGISILFLSLPVSAKLSVATTTPDLEAVVRAVGGNEVTSYAITKGTQDPHQIDAKPSFMVRLRDVDLMISQGLELESAWLLPLITGSRNPKIKQGSNGFLEVGPQLDPLEVQKGDITRAEGDVHPDGNPHFQLDPVRMAKAAGIIAEKMSELDGSHKELYQQNSKRFQSSLLEKEKSWEKRIQKSGVKEVVSYHKTFTYFFDRFGIKNTLQLEPKPGIPPTASHLLDVIQQMKQRGIKLVLIENFYDDSVKEKLMKEVPGVQVVRAPVSVGGDVGTDTNEELIEKLVKIFEGVAK